MQIEVTVKMNMATGAVEVTGPLDQKPLCVKALAAAINAVVDFAPKQAESKILVPPPAFRNGNGKKAN